MRRDHARSPCPTGCCAGCRASTTQALDEALRLAVAEGVLVPEGAGYAFPHDLLRAAVLDDLLPGERARLHAARAAALEAGADGAAAPAEVAHHFVEAGDAPKVLVWSVRAADEAMRLLAPQEALQPPGTGARGVAERRRRGRRAGLSRGTDRGAGGPGRRARR